MNPPAITFWSTIVLVGTIWGVPGLFILLIASFWTVILGTGIYKLLKPKKVKDGIKA